MVSCDVKAAELLCLKALKYAWRSLRLQPNRHVYWYLLVQLCSFAKLTVLRMHASTRLITPGLSLNKGAVEMQD